MVSSNKQKEVFYGWLTMLLSIASVLISIKGMFIHAGFVFAVAWWCFYKMQNYKHDQIGSNVLCNMVGHKPPVYAESGWYSPGEEYGKVIVSGADGIGRVHARVEAECARCHKTFTVARVHLPNKEK